MNLYISKKNLSSFIDSVEPNKINVENYKYVNCLLKFNIYFDFEKQKSDGGYGGNNDDDNDIDENSKIRSWMKRNISQGRDSDSKRDHYRDDCTQYPKKYSIEAIKDNKEYLSSVYLVENPEEGLENIVLCGKPGEETKVLKRLFCGNGNDFYQFHFLPKFSWTDLGDNIPPCTDIIISDKYLFSTTRVQEDFVRVYNIEPMLRALTRNTKGKINIVVFTSSDLLNKFGVNEAKSIITAAVSKNTGEDPNVFFIVPSPSDTKQPHDRIIITNYRVFVSGDSFLYFNSNGLETKGFYLISGSLAENSINNFKEEALIQLNNWYTLDKGRGCHIKGDKYGNKLSNLLSSTMNVIPEHIDTDEGKKDRPKQTDVNGYEGKIVLKNKYKNIKCSIFSFDLHIEDESGKDVEDDDSVNFTLKSRPSSKDPNKPYWFATNVRKKED